jgi:membrane protein DedA with SNARE-associated domain
MLAPPAAFHALRPALLVPTLLQLGHAAAAERLAMAWHYVALGGSSIVTEELAPVLGGIAAHEHELGLLRVMMACAVGSWAGMLVFYALGRWRGRWAAARWPRFGAHLTRILGAVERRPWRASIATRFAIGARWVLPAACGAAHVPLWLYLTGSGVSAALWSVPFTLLGWAFGEAAVAFVGRFQDYGALIGALLVALGVLLYLRWRRSAQRSPVRE